jgi:ectoine hydroxylase-related dioxygenase (phytanoyl-CoA dioxygenase family)
LHREATLRLIPGSHRWEKWVKPVRWLDDGSFYDRGAGDLPVPDPERDHLPILEWALEPGDAVAFEFRTVHGARGNAAATRRRSGERNGFDVT